MYLCYPKGINKQKLILTTRPSAHSGNMLQKTEHALTSKQIWNMNVKKKMTRWIMKKCAIEVRYHVFTLAMTFSNGFYWLQHRSRNHFAAKQFYHHQGRLLHNYNAIVWHQQCYATVLMPKLDVLYYVLVFCAFWILCHWRLFPS